MSGHDPYETAEPPGFAVQPGQDAVRLRQLARVSAELGAADTMDDVIEAAVRHAARAIGASVSTLMVTERDRLRMLDGVGLRDGVLDRWASFGLADRNPASEAARTGRPVLLDNADRIAQAYPALRDEMPQGRSLVCLPLDSSQPSVGVIGLTFESAWLPGPNELDFLTAYADACGQAVRRVRSSAAAEARARRLAFLAQVSQELSDSLDVHTTLRNVAALTVPELADWCAVSLAHRDGVHTVAVAHADPAMVQWAWQMQERYPTDPDAPTGAPKVIRTGVSEFYAELTVELLAAATRDEEQLRLARDLDLRSALIVPLSARGRTLGAITLVRTGDSPPYTSGDLDFAEDLGRRAGVAVDNAQLHEQTQDVALQLQRAVLPDTLGDVGPWEIATYYAPGGTGDVGGDFYDAITLPDGGLAFVIGDVMGHGVPAAAAMAQLRSAVRAYACLDPDPAAVVARLDVMFARLKISELATLVYGVVDAAGRASFVNAGHFAPLLVRPGEAPSFAQTVPRLPLGAGGDERAATDVELAAGTAMVLFTDGLVEHRGEIIDAGLTRLTDLADTLLDGPLQQQLDTLVAALSTDIRGDDDTTAFALRRRAGT